MELLQGYSYTQMTFYCYVLVALVSRPCWTYAKISQEKIIWSSQLINADPIKSKTKGIIFSKKPSDRIGVSPLVLNGNNLPWVSDIKYLGNILECDSSMSKDISTKRGRFIGKINSLKQEFHFASPDIKIKLLNIYTTSFYGSSLYNLYSKECRRFYTTWNQIIRQCFQVDRQTHRYLIEEMSESVHPKVLMASRLVGFHSSLLKTEKTVVNLLAYLSQKDCRTVHGSNLKRISNECDVSIGNRS